MNNKCPVCGSTLVESGGSDGNPYNKDRPVTYKCPKCGYTTSSSGPESGLRFTPKTITIEAVATGMGITINKTHSESAVPSGFIDLHHADYPLSELGTVVYNLNSLLVKDNVYHFGVDEPVSIVTTKSINTFDGHPETETDTFTITIKED